jgi:hypothetical protein
MGTTLEPSTILTGFAHEEPDVSKKTKKRKLRARRNKANHGKRPNVGRR